MAAHPAASRMAGTVIRVAPSTQGERVGSRLGWWLAGIGLAGLVVAVTVEPAKARSAAAQVWTPFVLVAGLLLIGLVAGEDGLFAAAGHRLATTARSGIAIFVGATVLVGVVTALLNLDTAVAFLTPVLVYAARSRGESEAPLLYGSLLLANAGSLFLPGSNLTNLIVLGHLHLTGAQFFARMWAPGLAALLVTAGVVVAFEHRALRVHRADPVPPDRPLIGLGLSAVVVATVLVVVLRSPALPVFAVGFVAIGVRVVRGRERIGHAVQVLGLPVLVGLFGVAVALGTLGRSWTAPATLLSHLNAWSTAAVAALASVLLNNLPASSLLAAHRPPHPYALLVGLNIGPNLLVTGSLAWFLWLRSARGAGAEPSIVTASRFGVVAVPLALVAAVGLLVVLGPH
jgi:arsenical pump membrane protein